VRFSITSGSSPDARGCRTNSPTALSSVASFVTRFAPSPTGLLHRGHAFSALTAFDAAHAVGGRFLLRLEDIDTARCRPEFAKAIFEDLAWLGLNWQEPVRRQSKRAVAYAQSIEDLLSRGLLYRCFRTRREVMEGIVRAPHGVVASSTPGPLLPEEEFRRLGRGDPWAWRLSLKAARRALGGFESLAFVEEGAGPAGESGPIVAHPEAAGDVVLARKDFGVSYHLAATVDDADQGITHVIRGDDLFEAAHIQCLLQALLGLPTPLYRHHPLILRPDGKRFAKRETAETLRDLHGRGVTPEALRVELGLAPLVKNDV
jgi:glutamyl-Q tRNA(Asp) synthetase